MLAKHRDILMSSLSRQGFAVDADIDMGESSKQSSTSSSWEPQCSLANSQSVGNHQMLSTDLTEPCPPQVMLTL